MTADTTDALVEKVALAMGNCIHARLAKACGLQRADVTTGANRLLEEAQAAIAAATPAIEARVIEECAKVADAEFLNSSRRRFYTEVRQKTCLEIAAAIRAMKGPTA